MTVVLLFVLGLVVGSFLNAVIFRLHAHESFIFGRSHCRSCKHGLAALDLVPVLSFLFLGGRCRYCRARLSWQYPLVEFLTAVIFVLLVSHVWVDFILAGFLIVIAVFDFKHYLILDKVVLPALVLVILRNLYYHNQVWLSLLAGLGMAGFFLLQYLLSKGKWIGLGDVKLGLVLGTLAGWPQSLTVLMLAYFSGALVGIILILSGRKNFGSKLPFGVFLCSSAIIVMIWGTELTRWYLKLMGL